MRRSTYRPTHRATPDRRPRLAAALTAALSTLLAATLSATTLGTAAPATAATTGTDTTIQVASFNVHLDLTPDRAKADIHRLIKSTNADVIGWQEMYRHTDHLRGLEGFGWSTWIPKGAARAESISWRTDEFALLDSTVRVASPYVAAANGQKARNATYLTRVTLLHHDTGQTFSIVNNHSLSLIEDWRDGRAGHPMAGPRIRAVNTAWRRIADEAATAPGTSLIVGDFNVDAFADMRVRHDRMTLARLGGVAVSNYKAMGGAKMPSTHNTGRHIDYVWAERSPLAKGIVAFTSQKVLTGYNSDHRPLVVNIKVRPAQVG